MKTAAESRAASYEGLLAKIEAEIEAAVAKHALEARVYVGYTVSEEFIWQAKEALKAKGYEVLFFPGFPGIFWQVQPHYLIQWNK
ncbi:hypothetical protein GCM10023185_13350 [Hymenobacter saemangeumensis]|uniref:Uncharacterized protein n=1 Tax=Hymenobacter saemangeumensis TaxID=1084522 RepID=A0ABP8I804_9BACT